MIVEQCRIVGVTESGVGLTNQFRLDKQRAKEGDNGEPADALQRSKPSVLSLREKHETKRLAKLLRAAGVGELFSRRFLLGEAGDRSAGQVRAEVPRRRRPSRPGRNRRAPAPGR